MRFLVDENLPLQVTQRLREQGHDVEDVREIGLAGDKDQVIWEYASKSGRIVITHNFADFSRFWRFSKEGKGTGLINLRLKKTPPSEIPALIANFLADYAHIDMKGRVAVISDSKVRFKPPL